MTEAERIAFDLIRRLGAGDADATATVLRSWRVARAAIEADIAAAAARAERQGRDPGVAVQNDRLLLAVVQSRVDQYVARITGPLHSAALRGARSGISTGRAVLHYAGVAPELTGVSEQAAAAITAIVNGPLDSVLRNLAAAARVRVQDALTTGLIAARNPRTTARAVTKAASIAPGRALTIARTETLRAHRMGAIQVYRQSGVVDAWYWLSARDHRTCPICWSLDGEVVGIETFMYSHPNCRCTLVPLPRSPSGAVPTPPTTGAAVFERLPASTQRSILGPGRHAAYEQGAALRDFVHTEPDPVWGVKRRLVSPEQALQNAEVRRTAAA